MPQYSKLQIRAKVLSVISEIKLLQYRSASDLTRICAELDDIDDKKAMFDIFIKEYIKLKEDDYSFCACVLKNTATADYISQKSIELLKSSSLTDEYKYKIVQLLRITGSNYDYSEISGYFENPQEVSDLETKRLLDSAVYNPESMLDFLDFVSVISERDKSLLLQSLNDDYNGDALANIVYPILYSDFSSEFVLQAVKMLRVSKSPLAIAPFEYLIKTSSDKEIVRACTAGLKELKLAGASKEKADEYFKKIIKNTKNAYNYVTIPDGSGRQALLTSRQHDNGMYSAAAVVISDTAGIIDCFGFFNISQEEVIRIIKKFYNSEGKYSVPAKYIKSRIDSAEKLNIKNKTSYPYEYICWSPMINASEPMKDSLEEYADANCREQIFSKEDAAALLTEEYTFRWFIMPEDNKYLKDAAEKIYDFEKPDINVINQLLKDTLDLVFGDASLALWKERFYSLIYILRQNNRENTADEFYTILKNEALFKLFQEIIMQKSILCSFTALKENIKNSFSENNIFRKRNNCQKNYDIKKLNEVLDILNKGWSNG